MSDTGTGLEPQAEEWAKQLGDRERNGESISPLTAASPTFISIAISLKRIADAMTTPTITKSRWSDEEIPF